MSTQRDLLMQTWPGRLAASVGERVKHYRMSRKPRMTAQDLADLTLALGHPLTRATIAGMEAGKRGTVTVADVLVLAEALDIPPVLLVFPVGLKQSVEVTPGVEMDTPAAVDWWSGIETIDDLEADENKRHERVLRRQPLNLTRAHQKWVRRWEIRTQNALRADDHAEQEFQSRSAAGAKAQVASLRNALRQGGFVLPRLPAGLDLDGEDSDAS